MGMPEPMNDAAMIQGGFQKWDQANAAAAEEKRQLTPDSVLTHAWARIQAGEDPIAVARELKAHPAGQSLLQSLQPRPSAIGPRPQDQLSQVGPGPEGPGYPALAPPGGVNPAHGPGVGQQPQPAQAAPQPQSLGAVPQQAPAPSQHQQMAAAIAPSMPASNFQQSLGQMGQPMQGAPQVSPQAAGASGSIPAPPPQAAPAQLPPSATVSPAGPDLITPRRWAQLLPIMPAMIGANARNEVAGEQARGRENVQNVKSQTALQIAQWKAQGIDDATIVKLMLGTAGEEGKQERFVEGEKGKTERAKIGANATITGARTRADAPKSGPNPILEDFKKTADQVKTWTAVTDWQTQPELKQRVLDAQEHLKALRQALGIPDSGAPAPTPSAGPKPAAPASTAGKIKVKLMNGKVGMIPAAGFDPKTMTKLPQ